MTTPDPVADLIAAATVGTAHRALDLADLPPAVRPDPRAADPAVALLDAAALSALAARTAPRQRTALRDPTDPVPERVPIIPDIVRQVLARVERQPALLVEALTLIRQAGLRLPPDLVPVLLDDARPAVVSAARPVTGEIGRLLMTKNPRWAPAAEPDPADRTTWDEGTVTERARWLRALRRTDPLAARELLMDGFARESATTRAELLGVLGDGLSAGDQDFLLTAVGDRSRAVVEVALGLLNRLPDSPLRRDMRALAGRHVTVARRLLRTAVTVTRLVPEEFAPWPAPAGDPWTVLLGRVDPVDWPAAFGGDPFPLITTGADELRPLTPGFRAAALEFRHAGLARALVSAQLAAASARVPPVVDPELWGILAPPDLRELLERLLDDRRVRADQVDAVLAGRDRPWPAPITRLLARWLPTGGAQNGPAPRSMWDRWATSAALPDCRELSELARAVAERATGDAASTLITRASQAATLLTVRAVLHETLRPPGGPQ